MGGERDNDSLAKQTRQKGSDGGMELMTAREETAVAEVQQTIRSTKREGGGDK